MVVQIDSTDTKDALHNTLGEGLICGAAESRVNTVFFKFLLRLDNIESLNDFRDLFDGVLDMAFNYQIIKSIQLLSCKSF